MQAEKLGSEGLCLLWWSSPNNATKTPRTCTTHSTGTWVSSSQQKVAAILEEEAAVAHFCTHCQHLYLKHKETLSSPSLTPGKERLCHSHGLRQKAAHMAVSAMCSLRAFSASLDKIKNLKEFNFFLPEFVTNTKKKKNLWPILAWVKRVYTFLLCFWSVICGVVGWSLLKVTPELTSFDNHTN